MSENATHCMGMIKSWESEGLVAEKELNSRQLHIMLEGAGLIAKVLVPDHDPIWVPTAAGEAIGIEHHALEPNEETGRPEYDTQVYSPEARAKILSLYKAGELPGADSLKAGDKEPDEWIEVFHRYLDERLTFLRGEWEQASEDRKREIAEAYVRSRVGEYDGQVDREAYEDELSASFYIARYAEFNAFEYATMARVIVDDLVEDNKRKGRVSYSDKSKGRRPSSLNIASFGCGPEMDLAGFLYQMAYGNPNKGLITYVPVELARWPFRFSEWVARNAGAKRYAIPRVVGLPGTVKEEARGGVLDFFNKDHGSVSRKQNVFLFPKIMSELDEELVDELVEGIRTTRFESDVVYVCISHLNEWCLEADEGSDSVRRGNRVLDAFANAMSATHDLVPGDQLVLSEACKASGLRCSGGSSTQYPWFAFGFAEEDRARAADSMKIWQANYQFSWLDPVKHPDGFTSFVKELAPYCKGGEWRSPRVNCYAINDEKGTANMGLAFQIVKFVRRKQ